MLSFPKSTEYGKKIPKQKFYNHISLSSAVKRIFSESIESIIWKNKLSPETISIAPGKTVKEIEVIEITMREPLKDDNVLRQIDIDIPYHILFIIKYENRAQLWIGYKEKSLKQSSTEKDKNKVTAYYHTLSLPEENLEIEINGLDMDAVYDDFIRQISDSQLIQNRKKSLKEAVDSDEQCKKIQKKIDSLEKRANKEKQWNIQMELDEEIRKLKKEIEDMKND